MEAIAKFKAELSKQGHPASIVWIEEKQMHLTKKGLMIYSGKGFVSESHVGFIYDKLKYELECGATFMLVAMGKNQSYCTLLLDSSGSKTELTSGPNTYLWVEKPYVSVFTFIEGQLKWVIAKLNPRILSSLDYAFTIKQTYT
ncbi:MAG: hypothetical protein AAF431_07540 [Pseudomonadota bacterium]